MKVDVLFVDILTMTYWQMTHYGTCYVTHKITRVVSHFKLGKVNVPMRAIVMELEDIVFRSELHRSVYTKAHEYGEIKTTLQCAVSRRQPINNQ